MTLGFKGTELPKKFSLQEHLAAQNADKHNSDMANIATAIQAAMDGIKAHKEAILKLEKVQQDLHLMAAAIEKGKEFDVSEVRKLYEAANEFSTNRIVR